MTEVGGVLKVGIDVCRGVCSALFDMLIKRGDFAGVRQIFLGTFSSEYILFHSAVQRFALLEGDVNGSKFGSRRGWLAILRGRALDGVGAAVVSGVRIGGEDPGCEGLCDLYFKEDVIFLVVGVTKVDNVGRKCVGFVLPDDEHVIVRRGRVEGLFNGGSSSEKGGI